MPAAAKQSVIEVSPIETQSIQVFIKGTTPLILNRMSEKAKHELLLPKGRKTAAEKASTLKHHPIEEFQAAPYIIPDEQSPTYIGHMASAFKQGMRTAALRVPGGNKTAIGQLVWVHGELVPIYGIPELFMSVTRSADINRTPDIRTRAIVPQWATALTITFTVPLITEKSIINLLVAAGQINGLGEWRPEKGSGNYGQFVLTSEDDPEFHEIVKTGGRDAQREAMENPVAYNQETSEMIEWFGEEVKRRGR